MPALTFNVAQARKDGLSDAEIKRRIAAEQAKGVDVQASEALPMDVDDAVAAPKKPKSLGDKVVDFALPAGGAILGGIAGSALGPAGAIAGATAGGALGETARQGIRGEELDAGKIALEGGLSAVGGVAGKVIGKSASLLAKGEQSAAKGIMNQVYKEPTKQATKTALSRGEQRLGEQVLDEGGAKGLNATQKFQNANKEIERIEDSIQEALTDSKRILPISEIKQAIKPLVDNYRKVGNVNAAEALEQRVADIENFNGKSVPMAIAQEIKRGLYREVRDARYGVASTANVEGLKVIAKGFKEGIAKRVDGISAGNQQLSKYGKLADSMLEKMTAEERKQAMGLLDTLLLAGGGAAGGVPGFISGAAAIGGRKVLGSMPAQETLAKGLNAAGKVTEKLADNKVATQIAGQTAVHGGASVLGVNEDVPSPTEEHSDTNDKKDPDIHNSNIIAQTLSVVKDEQGNEYKTDAEGTAYSMDEKWKFDTASDSWVENTPTAATDGEGNPQAPMTLQQYNTQLSQLAQAGDTASGRIYDKLKEERDYYYPEEGGGKPLAVAMQNRVDLAKSGSRGLEEAERIYSEDPSVLAKQLVPGQWVSRKFDSAMFKTVEALLRARSGAAVPEQEVRRYLTKYGAVFGDNPEVVKFKFDQLRQDFQDVMDGAQSSSGGGLDISNATLQY